MSNIEKSKHEMLSGFPVLGSDPKFMMPRQERTRTSFSRCTALLKYSRERDPDSDNSASLQILVDMSLSLRVDVVYTWTLKLLNRSPFSGPSIY